MQKFAQLKNLRCVRDPLLDHLFGQAPQLKPVGHVIEHRHVRVEGVVLEHHGDVPIRRFQVIDPPLTDVNIAGSHGFQARNHAQQSRFTAAAGTDDDHEFAIFDFPVDAIDDIDITEGFADIL